MKKYYALLLGVSFCFINVISLAQISLTGGVYSQDFNTLANTGTYSSVPAGWAFSESGSNANTTYTAGTGSSNTGDTYSFGPSANSDRAFGGLLSVNLNPTIGASFTNNTGSTITELQISYIGEQWRLGTSGRFDRLDFQYSLNATSLTTGTWTDFDLLDFIAPNSSGTVGEFNGNLPANRVAVSNSITSLTIPIGSTFWIRWSDFNASGADDGLGIDDFSLTPIAGTPTTITTGAITGSPFSVDCSTGASGTVAFTSSGTFAGGNVFTAQLSDAAGSFTSPVNVGTLSLSGTNPGGTINITIPAATSSGSGYKIRVVSSNPSVTGSESLVFSVNNSCPPTALTPGDIAIVAFNNDIGDGNGTDEISFVCFKNINPGTVIDITDNAYQKCGTPNGWGISEGWIRLQRISTALPAGEIITIRVTNGNPAALSPDVNWICSKPQPMGQGVFDMNANGEQIFFMAGGTVGGPNANTATSDAGTYSGYFLYGFNTKGNIWTPLCANSAGGGTQNSDKPLNFDCFLVWPTSQADKNKYTGPLTPTTQRDWIDRIGNPANWTGYPNNTAYNAGPDYINFNGPNLGRTIVINAGGFASGRWLGTTDNNWFECSNWESMRVPDASTNVVIPSAAVNIAKIDYLAPFSDSFNDTAKCNNLLIEGREVNIEGALQNILVVHGNLTIQNDINARLDMNDNGPVTDGQILLHGNWVNNKGLAEFQEGHGTIHFVGPNNQTISTVDPVESFYHLVVNKTGGSVTLLKHVEVGAASSEPIADRTGVLTLTARNIITGANYLYVTNPATGGISGGSAASFVDGNLRRHTNTVNLYDFPVGEGTRYMRAGVRTSNVSENVIEVDAQNTGYGTYTPLEPLPAGLVDVSTNRWWDVTKISGSTPVAVRLYWMALADDGIVDATQLVVAHWSDRDHSGNPSTMQWWNRGRNAGNSAGTVANGFVESSEQMSTYSPFTFGTLDPVNPLPVELISFIGSCVDGIKTLNWATASEINNAFFSIQRSTDGINYHELARIPGAGNSNIMQQYNYQDMDKSAGGYYYQLIQTDFDGQSESFTPIYVHCNTADQPSDEADLITVTSNQVIISTQVSQATQLTLSVMDLSGRTLFVGHREVPAGTGLVELNTQALPSGIYLLNIYSDVMNKTLRFFIR